MSALKKTILTDTVKLTATVAANLGVDLDGTLPSANGSIWGVSASKGVSGDQIPVDTLGITVGIAGAAVAAGADLKITADGKFITHTVGTTRVGRARTAAAAADDEIEIFLTP